MKIFKTVSSSLSLDPHSRCTLPHYAACSTTTGYSYYVCKVSYCRV